MADFQIGAFLKAERKKLGLTEKQFNNGVLSASQYSRMENCEQDLRATNLIKILSKNKINIEHFFEKVLIEIDVNSPKSEDEVLNNIAQSFYSYDLTGLKKIQKEIKKNSYNNAIDLWLELIIAILQDDVKNISEETKIKLSDELNKSEDWVHDKNFLLAFGNTMIILNQERLDIYMEKIISAYKNNICQQTFELQRRISGICINYLTNCYQKKVDLYVTDTLNLLRNTSENPDLLMYKLLGFYFESLFTKKDANAKCIKLLLEKVGYKEFIRNLP